MTRENTKCETPVARCERLIEEIANSAQTQYGKDEVHKILRNVIGAGNLWNGVRRVDGIARGDVFIAKVVGGKIRPWIALTCREGIVSAVSMSSGDRAPSMIQSQARYWPGAWIGITVSLFREDDVRDLVTLPYNNRDHLREIERHAANALGLRA